MFLGFCKKKKIWKIVSIFFFCFDRWISGFMFSWKSIKSGYELYTYGSTYILIYIYIVDGYIEMKSMFISVCVQQRMKQVLAYQGYNCLPPSPPNNVNRA